MNMDEYQHLAQRTASTSTPSAKIENGCLGLAGEAGEVCDLLKKYFYQGHELDKDAMLDELGDVLWYIAETAAGLGLTLDDVALHNIDKLRRRYPAGFDAKRSIHREGE